MDNHNHPRKSQMLLNEAYFWTDTIKDWKRLLQNNDLKMIIINCWQHLIRKRKIKIYAFVIMPNHIHMIWEMLEKNGKEMPYASFNKFTAHQFLEFLRANQHALKGYKVKDLERKHRFWQRDALAIHMYDTDILEQKLEYIHLNPLQDHWNLVEYPEDYRWSSARFYEDGTDEFGILTHYKDRF
ncbi:MAG: transposase [Bacteroidota bacterium]